MSSIDKVRKELLAKFTKLDSKSSILRDPLLRQLYSEIPKLNPADRSAFGQAVNELKQELEELIADNEVDEEKLPPIDVTAPFDVNVNGKHPTLLPAEDGTMHPLMTELQKILDVLRGMGFVAHESRQIDDDYHMFESLNFPADHPARDDYDTFTTEEGLIAPAHTSSMQNRILKKYKSDLDHGQAIRAVIPGRVFRNEDLDATHEHTFLQLEGVYVDKGIHAGHLIATLKTMLEGYYEKELDVKTQPFYFPFTEPSFEFAMSCPFCDKKGCKVCSYSTWIEILGCGMIHPKVLKMAGINPNEYTGFAWGGGIERLVMMKNNIEDIRYFESGKLEFLRQFK